MEHWHAVKNIFRYLRNTANMGILYNGSTDSTYLEGYADADYAGDLETRRSTSGYIFTMMNGAVTWESLQQKTVSLSTTEAEYIATCESVKEALWIKQLLKDIEYPCADPIVINLDNQSAIKLIKNPEFHKRSKHIDIRYHFVREKYLNNDIVVNTYQVKNKLRIF